jgi:GAF domain-containing protein
MTALNYDLLARQAEELIRSVPYRTANLANLSALLNDALTDINWVGFYLAEGDTLVLGPFQGKPACIEIPFGKGVCGTAAALDATQLVPDVHAFPGHIACDCASRSEIVIPMHCGGRVAAVLDIDSPRLARFTESDRLGLETLVRRVEGYLFPTED